MITRAFTRLIVGGAGALVLSFLASGCAKVKPNDPRHADMVKAETNQQKAACASSAAYGRIKDLIFDKAVGERAGDRANLDTLADYSIIRMDDPVVVGWEPSLDMTRCRGHLILEIPPGAERGLAGARRLRSDIEYSAQAAADGSGLVYQLSGAEVMISKLAAFNLTSVSDTAPHGLTATIVLPQA